MTFFVASEIARFEKAMKRVLSVPHSEIKRRIEEHRKEAALNPNKRRGGDLHAEYIPTIDSWPFKSCVSGFSRMFAVRIP